MPTLLCSPVVLLPVLCLRGPPVAASSMMCTEGCPAVLISSLSLTASRIIGMNRQAWFFLVF